MQTVELGSHSFPDKLTVLYNGPECNNCHACFFVITTEVNFIKVIVNTAVVSILLSLFICTTDLKQSEFSYIVTKYVLEIMCDEQKFLLL